MRNSRLFVLFLLTFIRSLVAQPQLINSTQLIRPLDTVTVNAAYGTGGVVNLLTNGTFAQIQVDGATRLELDSDHGIQLVSEEYGINYDRGNDGISFFSNDGYLSVYFGTDNAYDFGKTAVTNALMRPRDMWIGRDVHIGNGLQITEGTNQRMGVVTLSGGTATVANTSVTANTRIFLTVQTPGGTQGFLSTTNTAGTSFTVNSTSSSETSTVAWLLVEPN